MMGNLKYRGGIILRLILTISSCILSYIIFVETPFWLLGIFLALLGIIFSITLLQFATSNEREVHNFLISMSQDDFSIKPAKEKYALGKKIPQDFEFLKEKYELFRREKESEHALLLMVIEHMATPIIGFYSDDGKLIIKNKAAELLFQKPFENVKMLYKIHPEIQGPILNASRNQSKVIQLIINGVKNDLTIRGAEIILSGKKFKLISFQNITEELMDQELISWQVLIRILTHEIKNSAIPISTMSEVLHNSFMDKQEAHFSEEEMEKLNTGLSTIRRRSKNLAEFIKRYDKLSRIPNPEFEMLSIKPIIDLVIKLVKEQFPKVEILNNSDPQHQSYTDGKLLEQVLINLVKNASEAVLVSSQPEVKINTEYDGDNFLIHVIDNGPGISEEEISKIFIPFFTTKEKGSGIGLSFSQQTLRKMGGKLIVNSSSSGTVFTAILPGKSR